MKRKFAVLMSLVLFVSVLMPISSVDASDTQKVKLKNFYIEVPYDQKDVNIVKTETGTSTRIDVVDKKTNEVIESYGEIIEGLSLDETKFLTLESENYITGTYYLSTVYKERTDGPTKSRLSTQMNMYTDGSFSQINSVVATWWSEQSSGPWYHTNEQSSSISRTGSFPTYSIQTQGSATNTVETSWTLGGAFSISALELVGFVFDRQVGTTVYMRKGISLDHVYSLY